MDKLKRKLPGHFGSESDSVEVETLTINSAVDAPKRPRSSVDNEAFGAGGSGSWPDMDDNDDETPLGAMTMEVTTQRDATTSATYHDGGLAGPAHRSPSGTERRHWRQSLDLNDNEPVDEMLEGAVFSDASSEAENEANLLIASRLWPAGLPGRARHPAGDRHSGSGDDDVNIVLDLMMQKVCLEL